jgi:hypothetical protein
VRNVARLTLRMTACLALVTMLLAGCAPKGPVYVKDGKNYDKSTAIALLASVDAGSYSKERTSDGPKLRHAALAALRRNGPAASSAADLLTRTFPSKTAGVPVYVEHGSFNSVPAYVVIEATGPASGHLNSKRIWIVTEKGDILFAGSR